jgi:hypothetical protein
MKNTNTISFYIGVIFGAGLTLIFLSFPPATSTPTTQPTPTPTTQPTPTPTPTEEPEKW